MGFSVRGSGFSVAISVAILLGLLTANPASAVTISDCAPTTTGTFSRNYGVIGDDCVIAFKSGTGTWRVPVGVSSVRVLVVAGGGGGGNDEGGGGGAGGFLEDTSFTVTPNSTVTVTVGAGGDGSYASTNLPGENGQNSVFGSMTAIGGGGGGTAANFSNSTANQNAYFAGRDGGSGGGGKGTESTYTFAGNAGGRTVGQGNVGGSGGSTIGGGGGGAGSAGSSTGAGGAGKISTIITTALATSWAVGDVVSTSVYFAGGGGGGRGNSTSSAGGSGGNGGGGLGGDNDTKNVAGQANTGGGGGGGCGSSAGGCGVDNSNYSGASGGSGVVIVRYAYDSTSPTLSSISVNSPNSGDYFKLNDYIQVTITFNENVVVTGSPFLTILVGANYRNASYYSGSGTTNLVFRYQITSSDTDADGISVEAGSINLNSGTLRDAYANDAARSFSAVNASTSRKVDGVIPTVSISSNLNNRYSSRKVTFNLSFSESISGFDPADATDLKIVVGENPSCSDADNSVASGWTKSTSGSGADYSVTLSKASPDDTNIKACVVSASGVDQAGNSVGATDSSFGLTRASQVTRWIKFLWGEELERF